MKIALFSDIHANLEGCFKSIDSQEYQFPFVKEAWC